MTNENKHLFFKNIIKNMNALKISSPSVLFIEKRMTT